MSGEEIAQEIGRGLDFLSVSTRDLPTRHRSMRAVFDHLWRLLTEKSKGSCFGFHGSRTITAQTWAKAKTFKAAVEEILQQTPARQHLM